MRIIGFNLTKISSEKKGERPKKLDVTQNIDIKDVIIEKISLNDKDSIKIIFNFSINYQGDYAKIDRKSVV